MKAWIFKNQALIENLPLVLKEVPKPDPGVRELRKKNIACGVCRTDIHIAEGDLPLKKSPNYQYSLSNYPNPFDNTTTIIFSLDETCSTTLSVYNTLGNNVVTLYSGMAEEGQEYKFLFNGTALSEGMYYYHLQSGTKVNTVKKMVMIK